MEGHCMYRKILVWNKPMAIRAHFGIMQTPPFLCTLQHSCEWAQMPPDILSILFLSLPLCNPTHTPFIPSFPFSVPPGEWALVSGDSLSPGLAWRPARAKPQQSAIRGHIDHTWDRLYGTIILFCSETGAFGTSFHPVSGWAPSPTQCNPWHSGVCPHTKHSLRPVHLHSQTPA